MKIAVKNGYLHIKSLQLSGKKKMDTASLLKRILPFMRMPKCSNSKEIKVKTD